MEKLTSPCCYRTSLAYCHRGMLYDPSSNFIIRLESSPVQCPMCEGRGRLLTDAGRELMIFIDTYARPRIYEIVQEIVEDAQG